MESIIILTSTFSPMAKYTAAIKAATDRSWPGHPQNYFISDCRIPHIENQISISTPSWTEMLLHGLLRLRTQHPEVKQVFHMLDDHCPLRACDTETISAYLETSRRHDLSVVSFPTYEWPWDRTESIEYPDGLVRTWRRIEVEVIDGRQFAIVPYEFFRYFQVQPACWRINYLIEACKTALDRGIHDVWSFEAMRWDGACQHYVAAYEWPSVHHGFMAVGKINPAAISYISVRCAPELRGQLIRDAIGANSAALYRLYGTIRLAKWLCQRLGNRLKAMLQIIKLLI